MTTRKWKIKVQELHSGRTELRAGGSVRYMGFFLRKNIEKKLASINTMTTAKWENEGDIISEICKKETFKQDDQ